jgi:uncharacterized protein (TIGR00251 family)
MNVGPRLSVRDTPEGAIFEVHLHPRAKRTAITGILDGRLKLALTSPPVDGRANEELQRFLAKSFDVSRSAVVILAGEHSRSKRVLIAGRDAAAVLSAIGQALAASKLPTS